MDATPTKHVHTPRRRPDKSTKKFRFGRLIGYTVTFIDCGAKGIKLEFQRARGPWWDKLAAALLPPDEIDRFMVWLKHTQAHKSKKAERLYAEKNLQR